VSQGKGRSGEACFRAFKALCIVRERGPIKLHALADAVDASPETVRGWMSEAEALGLVGVETLPRVPGVAGRAPWGYVEAR
jgi:predicted ArsR family transcriptional regulator